MSSFQTSAGGGGGGEIDAAGTGGVGVATIRTGGARGTSSAPAARKVVVAKRCDGIVAEFELATELTSPTRTLQFGMSQHICAPSPRRLRLASLALLAHLASAQLSKQLYTMEHEQDTDTNPWVPCEKPTSYGSVKGFCRQACAAFWAYAPDRLDCEMLPRDELLKRAHSKGMEPFRQLSLDSYSKVNSGPSDPMDPDTG